MSFKPGPGAAPHIFKLTGPLYGQRSASRRWYETFSDWLRSDEMGFEPCSKEPCMFWNRSTGARLALYVDDVLLRATREVSERFHEQLQGRFKCRGEADYLTANTPLEFLGFELTMEHAVGGDAVYMDQCTVMEQFLNEFNAARLQLKDAPMPTKKLLRSDPCLSVPVLTYP